MFTFARRFLQDAELSSYVPIYAGVLSLSLCRYFPGALCILEYADVTASTNVPEGLNSLLLRNHREYLGSRSKCRKRIPSAFAVNFNRHSLIAVSRQRYCVFCYARSVPVTTLIGVSTTRRSSTTDQSVTADPITAGTTKTRVTGQVKRKNVKSKKSKWIK